jgi:hypothetical protein
MQFENVNIQNLVTDYRDFSVEGFNIFAIGKDHLPHLICVCPNKTFARAIQSLLAVAKFAIDLKPTNGEINSDCRLVPRVLANGRLALVASVIDNAVWKNGNEVEDEKLELCLGTTEYRNFAASFLEKDPKLSQESNSTAVLDLNEDTLTQQKPPED